MYNQAFEMQLSGNDRDSIYLDAISLSSDKNSIGFSRQSIYHSIQDLHFQEDQVFVAKKLLFNTIENNHFFHLSRIYRIIV